MAVAASELWSSRHWATSITPKVAVEVVVVIIVVGNLMYVYAPRKRCSEDDGDGGELHAHSVPVRGKLSGT